MIRMKNLSAFCGALVSYVTLAAGLEPARVSVYCTSLRFEATAGGPGQAATLQLTTDPAFGEMNGELAALFDPRLPSHGALFLLDDPTLADQLFGQMFFDQPEPVDANGNGFDDFFEVGQGVSATTRGFFEVPVDTGTVTATWNRSPGSSVGTCRLELTTESFGDLPTFTPTFELLEYQGTLTYHVNSEERSGAMALAQTGGPEQTLAGDFPLSQAQTNRFNLLVLREGALTNAAGQSLPFLSAVLERDETSETNYFGFLDFEDGDPATGTLDYLTWVLSIDDLNDSDEDGIPDLSDDARVQPPGGPTLAIRRSGGEVLLSIQGESGGVYDLQQTESLVPASWSSALSVTLTNAAQTVPLAEPGGSTRFWRLHRP